MYISFIVVVQLLSCVQLFVTPWTAAHQASLSLTVSEFDQTHVHWIIDAILSSVIHFSSCLPSFPASGSFPISQLFSSGGHSIEVSASASVLLMNIQDWFHLGLISFIIFWLLLMMILVKQLAFFIMWFWVT